MEYKAEQVYQTLCGEMETWAQVPGVENLFEEGKLCHARYETIYAAYQKICGRLGVKNEDADLESIINAFMDIEHELCIKMYEYGVRFGKEGNETTGIEYL